MSARKRQMVSSWKLESSSTFHRSGRDEATIAATGVPILPPTWTGTPASRRMWPVSEVVVVLPFDPVMPIVWPWRNGAASSTLPQQAFARVGGAGVFACPNFASSSFRLPNLLPQLQRRQREQRHHQPRDPEPGDDLRFRPPQRLEMVVQRRHLENALAPQLE